MASIRVKAFVPPLRADEEARVQAMIAADPEDSDVTDEEAANAIPASEFFTPDELGALMKRRDR